VAKITYQGKDYHSKSDLIKELYETGKLSNDILSKKQIAKELNINFLTVQITLDKIVQNNTPKILSVNKKGKESEVLVFRHDEETTNKGKRIKVTWAPNQWDLPITNPPLYVIDNNFKGDVYTPEKENTIGELIQY
jgi:hypothetical protein